MSRKRLWTFATATVTTGTAMWLLAGLWHELIVARFYAAETGATHEGTGIIYLAYLLLAAMMACLYPLSSRGGRPEANTP